MKASSLLRIGDKIRELRESKKWTQKQLAEASQINEVQIRRYENNQSLPRDAQLIKIANALDVNKDDFFKPEVYRISIPEVSVNDIQNRMQHPTSSVDFQNKMKSMREKLENISKCLDETRQEELKFIQAFIENKENDVSEIDRISDLLWYYDTLEEDEKTALILLTQIFSLANISGKNKILEFSEIIFGNPNYRKEE